MEAARNCDESHMSRHKAKWIAAQCSKTSKAKWRQQWHECVEAYFWALHKKRVEMLSANGVLPISIWLIEAPEEFSNLLRFLHNSF